MTLSKKKSRPITVNHVDYRWTISPDCGYMVFVAEKNHVKGRKIQVYIDSEIHTYWDRFPNVNTHNMRVIKPKDAESIIKQAIVLGWNPEEKGPPLVFDLDDNDLKKRISAE